MKRTAALLLVVIAACSGTSSKRGKSGAPGAGKEAAASQAPGASEAVEASLRGKVFQAVPALKSVRFDYDAARLTEQAMVVLKANAEWLKRNPRVEVQIQGHCDERGTTAYNLALGQRRARAVRDYYRALGVPAGRLSTISYGEESPLCARSDEECWSVNRRAETLARIDDDKKKYGRKK